MSFRSVSFTDISNLIELPPNLAYPSDEVVLVEDNADPEICKDYPFLDDDIAPVASGEDSTEPEICLDYPFLDHAALLDNC